MTPSGGDKAQSEAGGQVRPSQRRNLARACIEYVRGALTGGPVEVSSAWQGERLFEQHANFDDGIGVRAPIRDSNLNLDGFTAAQVRRVLALDPYSLNRFKNWSDHVLERSFVAIYVAEGGDAAQRRQAVLEFIQTGVGLDLNEALVLCGNVDPDIARRLRAFNVILLSDIAADSGFTLEELTFLVAHEASQFFGLGTDDFTHLLGLLRPQATLSKQVEWTEPAGVTGAEREHRLGLARKCLEVGAPARVEGLLSDRGLGGEADLYLALSHLKQSNFKEAAYYCDRLQEAKGAADNELFNRIQAAVKTQEARDRREQRSYALNQLDLKLLPYLGEQPGIFIEAGGNDGISQSNTLYFERHHQWRGILVEGIPDLAEKCLVNRPRAWVENCALVPFDFNESTVSMTYCNLMSVVDGAMKTAEEEAKHIAIGEHVQQLERYQIDVRTKTLSSVIESYDLPRVDLLSLDVEGYELQVLQGLDLERHGPVWMLIEARYRDEIDAFVGDYYEVVDVLSYHDVLYRRRGV